MQFMVHCVPPEWRGIELRPVIDVDRVTPHRIMSAEHLHNFAVLHVNDNVAHPAANAVGRNLIALALDCLLHDEPAERVSLSAIVLAAIWA